MIKRFSFLILGIFLVACTNDLSKMNFNYVYKPDLTKSIYIAHPKDLNKDYAIGSGFQVLSRMILKMEELSKDVNSADRPTTISKNLRNAKKEKADWLLIPVIKKWETTYLGLSDRVSIEFNLYEVKSGLLIYQTVVEDTNCPLYLNNSPELLMEDIADEFVKRAQGK